MDKFRIKGGKALRGTVAISGAKNSALPVMAAALLTSEKVTLHNIPKVRDLITMSKLLAFMDAKVTITEFPMGPLMARVGVARVSLPGGCAIGARPVDLHLKALEQMGAEIGTSHGYIEAKVRGNGHQGRRLKGARIGAYGDSGPDRGGDVSAGGGHYWRGFDDHALCAGAFGGGDCEIGAGGSSG